MSKTHKITQLKKRIAELEKKLNRREELAGSFKAEKVTAYTVKVERTLIRSEYEQYGDQPEYRQHVIEKLMRDITQDATFCRCVSVEGKGEFDPHFPEVRVRASIMVLPFHGNIWED